MGQHLASWSAIVRRLIADAALDEKEKLEAFMKEALLDLERKVGTVQAEQYTRAGRLDYSWQGLSRYWRKRTA
jgi:hypothetical protein